MDLQIARVRVVAPQPLDFAALADGVRRNNVGVAAIRVHAQAAIEAGGPEPAPGGTETETESGPAGAARGSVRLLPTGQRFPLEGSGPARAEAARWRAFAVMDYDDPARTALRPLP